MSTIAYNGFETRGEQAPGGLKEAFGAMFRRVWTVNTAVQSIAQVVARLELDETHPIIATNRKSDGTHEQKVTFTTVAPETQGTDSVSSRTLAPEVVAPPLDTIALSPEARAAEARQTLLRVFEENAAAGSRFTQNLGQ